MDMLSKSRRLISEAHLAFNALRIRFDHFRVLRSLRKDFRQNKKIKVIFLVSDTAKWKCQALFEALARDGRFEPQIALTFADKDFALSDSEKSEKVKSNLEYFMLRGMSVTLAINEIYMEPISLRNLDPGIVFYQQPWHIPFIQQARQVGKYALTCYVPYFVPTYGDVRMHCEQRLHYELWRHFVLNKAFENFYNHAICRYRYAGKIVGIGHPMLDHLMCCKKKRGRDNRRCVIYAPHWSLPLRDNPNTLNLSTFLENGKYILNFAMLHPEIKWVFRPHPTLRYTLQKTGVWTDKAIEEYYREWERIGSLSNGGDYISIFADSDVLITDCDSFLSEYPCTGNPIIHLVSRVPSTRSFSPLKNLFLSYYRVNNIDELSCVLHNIVVMGNDPNRVERLRLVRSSGLMIEIASKRIIGYLKDSLHD